MDAYLDSQARKALAVLREKRLSYETIGRAAGVASSTVWAIDRGGPMRGTTARVILQAYNALSKEYVIPEIPEIGGDEKLKRLMEQNQYLLQLLKDEHAFIAKVGKSLKEFREEYTRGDTVLCDPETNCMPKSIDEDKTDQLLGILAHCGKLEFQIELDIMDHNSQLLSRIRQNGGAL